MDQFFSSRTNLRTTPMAAASLTAPILMESFERLPPCSAPTYGVNCRRIQSHGTVVDDIRRRHSAISRGAVGPEGWLSERRRQQHRHRTTTPCCVPCSTPLLANVGFTPARALAYIREGKRT